MGCCIVVVVVVVDIINFKREKMRVFLVLLIKNGKKRENVYTCDTRITK